MAASHYAYNMLKMLGPMSVITVGSDKKDVLICADQLYQEAVVAPDAKAPAPATGAPEGKKTGKTSVAGKASGPGQASCTHSGKRASSGCCVSIEDVPESSTGKSRKSRVAPPETKKVPIKEDGMGGAFTISSTLDIK